MARILSITIKGYKCFQDSSTLIEPTGITALTGANDTGKSSFLNSIVLLCSPSQSITADEVCTIADSPKPTVEIQFETQRESELGAYTNLPAQKKLTLRRRLPTGPADGKYELELGDGTPRELPAANTERFFPTILFLTPESFMYRYSRTEPVTVTGQILANTFGFKNPKATIQQHAHEIEAKQNVSRWLEKAWTANQKKEFDFVRPEGDIGYIMRDELGEFRPVNLYGSGFQHYATMAIRIEHLRNSVKGPRREGLVLIDEPERSLHPRAQRDFLSYLKSLGPEFQVIYATHSPSMIDQSEPSRVRVFVKDVEARNVRIFHKKTKHDNYEQVRMALGVLPSDSLLFGRLNIIVEGAIEYLCLPIISRILEAGGKKHLDFAQATLINGHGSELPRMFVLALATNNPTVAIVDDDRHGREYERKIKKYLEDSRTNPNYESVLKWISKDEGGESQFEDLFPLAKYIAAVNEICKPNPPLTNADLEVNKERGRASRIEAVLKARAVNYDEYKTDIALQVAARLDVAEAGQFESIFAELSEILAGKPHVETSDLELGNSG